MKLLELELELELGRDELGRGEVGGGGELESWRGVGVMIITSGTNATASNPRDV